MTTSVSAYLPEYHEWEDYLGAKDDKSIYLRKCGAEARNLHFGKRVFVRGVIELSNYCRENCSYCGMRRDNRTLSRFRLQRDQIVQMIESGLPSSITDLNLQTGEDPRVIEEVVLPVVQYLRAHTGLGISLCLGTLDSSVLNSLRSAGAFYYILKLETGDEAHYADMSAPGTYKERMGAIHSLVSSGWKVSSGMIFGLPRQTSKMAVDTLRLLSQLPLSGVSVSPFISGDETPFAGKSSPETSSVIHALALLRLANPQRIIPAVSALSLLGNDAYGEALEAGANLVTINLTPEKERDNYLLYKRKRFIVDEKKVRDVLLKADLEPSRMSMAEHFSSVNSSPARLHQEA